jgi:putative hydrolase of the HAD superfamily
LDHYGHTHKEQVYRQIAAEFGLNDVWPQLLADYFEEPWTCLHLPGLEPMLQTLQAQNRKLGIITNGPSPFQEKKIQAMGIAHYFSVVLVSTAEGVAKPDPEIFWRAADKLGVKPAETVFVGDNPQADMKGAQVAGMRTIWKRVDHWGECLNPDAICVDLAELPALIQQLET